MYNQRVSKQTKSHGTIISPLLGEQTNYHSPTSLPPSLSCSLTSLALTILYLIPSLQFSSLHYPHEQPRNPHQIRDLSSPDPSSPDEPSPPSSTELEVHLDVAMTESCIGQQVDKESDIPTDQLYTVLADCE